MWQWVTMKMTPFNCGITETIHCLTKSRELVDAMNRLGTCMSYDSMKRIDTDIAKWIIEVTGENRCPVSDDIKPGYPIQCAVDNFNHQERSMSGISVSNDTVLVIFQNQIEPTIGGDITHDKETFSSRKPCKSKDRSRALETVLPCQQLIESRLGKKAASIPENFVVSSHTTKNDNTMSLHVEDDYFLWWFYRNIMTEHEDTIEGVMPSFIALNSKIRSATSSPPRVTSRSFIPILPYPATAMDSIYTSMVNFKDVLLQRNEECGAMWCDEGVYCLAREIQFLRPKESDMLFIGMGPFHWCKVLCAAMGKYLEPSGITQALSNSGVFGKGVAESSVMKGGDYVQAKDGMSIISEAIAILQYEEFLQSASFIEDESIVENQNLTLENLQDVKRMLYYSNNADDFADVWERSKVSGTKLKEAYQAFLSSCESNENFRYWNQFQRELYPILRDFELSVRNGDWKLFVSAIERSLHPFFSGSRPNYSRYGSIFYEDCLELQRRFPALYKHYMKGGFVCYLTKRNSSGIGIDQGLEKIYNFTAKAVGGIIGMTRQKISVALWDLLKHDKDLFVSFLKDVTTQSKDQTSGELNSLHHEFSAEMALKSTERVTMLVDYIKSIESPFGSTSERLINIVTKEEVDNSEFYLNFVSFGSELHKNFAEERLLQRSVGLHATITVKFIPENTYMAKKKKAQKPIASDETENGRAARYIQYALSRGKTVDHILQFPITTRPVFLLEKDELFQKKSQKSDLAKLLLKVVKPDEIISASEEFDGNCPCIKSDAIVIDLMSVVRKITSVELKGAKSFGSLCGIILNAVLSYGAMSDQVHLIFENYKTFSPKASERIRRSKASNVIGRPCHVVADDQRLPDWDEFNSLIENKSSLQDFFAHYCTRNYKSDKPLYLAGGLQQDPNKCTMITSGKVSEAQSYRASHEEADDRIMFSIQQIYRDNFEQGTVTVCTPDTDIFVVLLYHLRNTWPGLRLHLLKSGSMKVTKKIQKELYPLNLVLERVEGHIIDQLPAGHSLTGCDTVAKVGTKLSLLNTLETDEDLLPYFGKDHRLDPADLADAEQFLVKVLSKKFQMCSCFNQLRVKLYHDSQNKRFIDLPCSSDEIQQNIRRAYLQTRIWLESPFCNAADTLDALNYGFSSDPNRNTLEPCLSTGPQKPLDVPDPCSTCTNCSRSTCPCRVVNFPCSAYCSCSEHGCKSPLALSNATAGQ